MSRVCFAIDRTLIVLCMRYDFGCTLLYYLRDLRSASIPLNDPVRLSYNPEAWRKTMAQRTYPESFRQCAGYCQHLIRHRSRPRYSGPDADQ